MGRAVCGCVWRTFLSCRLPTLWARLGTMEAGRVVCYGRVGFGAFCA